MIYVFLNSVKRIRPLSIFASMILGLGLTVVAWGGTVEVKGKGGAQLYVVKVHADWCGSCTALEPILTEVKTSLADKPVLFVTLDVTDAAKVEASRLLAAALDIEGHMKANNKTGLVLLISAKDKKLVETLTKANAPADMVQKIGGYLHGPSGSSESGKSNLK